MGAEIAFEKITHLVGAIADQRNHIHVGFGLASDHSEQRRLACARCAKDRDTLAAPDRCEHIDRLDAGLERLPNALSAKRLARPFGADAKINSKRSAAVD